MAKTDKIRVLYISPNRIDGPWISGEECLAAKTEWSLIGLAHEGSIARFLSALFIRRRLGCYDIVVTAEYFVAAGLNLRLLLTGSRARHLIWGLNQSRKALTQRMVKPLADRLFRRTDAIVVHSRSEIGLFCAMHGMRSERFDFVHWGFDIPSIKPTVFSEAREPYVCLVGRNNRDLLTFAKGLEGTGVKGVVIADEVSPAMRRALDAAGIQVHLKADFNTCLDCIRNAMASAVLLNDSSRGAGHITMVSAMFLGVPQIVTNSPVVEDYFARGIHGIGVTQNSVQEFHEGVISLRDDGARRRRMGEAAREYAHANFTNGAVASRFREIVERMERMR